MCWFGILGVFIAFHTSTYAAKYSVSGFSTEWLNANCTKAAPILSYNNLFFEVNKTSTELTTSEVWIGYFEAKVPFYFHGCAVVQNEPTYRVTRIGFCKSICVNTTLFGIQAGVGQDIVNPTEGMNCRCVDKNIDEIALGKCGSKNCSQDCYTIFSQFTDSVHFNTKDTGRDSDCLIYYNRGFEWQACTRSVSIKPLCSNSISTDPSEIKDIERATWTEGNADCLNDDRYPATVASIKNTQFEPDEEGHYYWTGIVRARTVLREDSTGERLLTKAESTYLSDVSYGFLDGKTGKLNFTSNGIKPALCTSEGPMDDTESIEGQTTIRGITKSTEGPTAIRDVTQSTTGPTITDVTESTKESWALWVGIGVSVAVLVVVVVIIVLRRRKRLQRFTSLKRSSSVIDNINCEAKSQGTTEKSVSDNNCQVKGKYRVSENEHLDHNSAANDPNVAIVDAVIYHTINDAEEPRGNVKGDTNNYDYTTTKAVKTESNNDNVYNKLKLERHCDYSHVKGHCQVHDQTTSNHYETASVSFHANATQAGANDDYDHVEGK